MKTLLMILAMSAPAWSSAGKPATEAACAAEDMQLAYYWLAPELPAAARARTTSCHAKNKDLRIPEWLEAARPAMLEKKAWKDPEEGDLSEARVWQDAFSILYEFAEKTSAALSAAAPGAASSVALAAEYADMRTRLLYAMDRIYRARLQGSLGGRGGSLLASIDAASQHLELLVSAVYAGDGQAAFEARVRTLSHAREVFLKLLLPAPPASARAYAEYRPEPRLFPGYRAAAVPVRGSQAMFLRPGDRVDMMVTFDAIMADERKEKVTATILQNVLVLNVSRAASAEGMAVVQLLCNPNEAQYAALSLMQGGGNISLPRRAEGDAELHPMEIATFRKLFK
ncbi:MAG: RcpC/CpaB family pilus assembly protein [Elusimicrobiales bacterium]|jgi:hypothetical protein|nr:RcpC/CpaB family pilus assembly protein [Elusimicrobiales bacterium]